jgi:hypothetical protein
MERRCRGLLEELSRNFLGVTEKYTSVAHGVSESNISCSLRHLCDLHVTTGEPLSGCLRNLRPASRVTVCRIPILVNIGKKEETLHENQNAFPCAS